MRARGGRGQGPCRAGDRRGLRLPDGRRPLQTDAHRRTAQTFRTTRAGALAYFVGGDQAFPKDTGFALKGWTKCDFTNIAIFIAGDTATTMGNVSITGKDGKITTVDKTWKFVKDDNGKLRIVVHHSSLPFSG